MQEFQGTFSLYAASKGGRPGEVGTWERLLERKG